MILDYIKERYHPADFGTSFSEVAEQLEKTHARFGVQRITKDFGFITFKPRGDAMVIYDLFIKESERSSGKAWDLFNEVQQIGLKLNKSVIITSSDLAGKNRHLGLSAIKAAHFIPFHTLTSRQLFIRGI